MIQILLIILLFLLIELIIIELLRIFSNIPNRLNSPQKTDKNLPSEIK